MGVINQPRKQKKGVTNSNKQECDINTQRVISTRKVKFPPAQCDFHTHECNFDTYEYDYDAFECGLSQSVFYRHRV
jgi:hypothetical protein